MTELYTVYIYTVYPHTYYKDIQTKVVKGRFGDQTPATFFLIFEFCT